MEIHQLTDTVSDPQSTQRWISGVTTDSFQDHKDTHPPMVNHNHGQPVGTSSSAGLALSGRMLDSQSRESPGSNPFATGSKFGHFFVLFTMPQFTQLYKLVPGYRRWWKCE